jgi:hypothetical protein
MNQPFIALAGVGISAANAFDRNSRVPCFVRTRHGSRGSGAKPQLWDPSYEK